MIKKFWGNKSKRIISIVLVVAITGTIIIGQSSSRGTASSSIDYTELYPTELVNIISTKGRVESAEKSNVYSSVNYTVQTVNVEVGDWVEQGQVLCRLDTRSLELDIARAISDRRDSQNNYSTQISNAQSNLVSAELDLASKRRTYETNAALYEMGAITQNEYMQSEDAYVIAQNKYNDAQVNLQNTQRSANSDSQSISIQKLEQQLADARIAAPQSGIVTAVYAKEGAAGSGLLFVIEDIENLKITTTIKEYDVSNVQEGMAVTIKSDSTGNTQSEGILRRINPTAVKNANGETNTLSGVEFEAEVEISSSQTDLKIGMETRLNIVLDRKSNVYCVPFDAVKTDRNGVSVIFILEESGNQYIARQITVTTGMETDFYIEISGDELGDGIKVLNDASNINDGERVRL